MIAGLICLWAGPLSAKTAVPFLGLQIQGLSPIIVQSLGLESDEGVMVRDIAFPGPASQSDLRRGDIIIKLNGKVAKSVEVVTKMMSEFKPGDKVKATVIRRNKTLDLMIKIGGKPPIWDVTRNKFATIAPLGITFASLTDKVQERFDLGWRSRGVVVSLVDEEKAAGLDIKIGDVIVQVNQSPVWKPGHIIGYMKKAQKQNKEMVLLLLERSNGFRFALLPVPK
ncbi:PDZ domain-containing protein [Terasakiella sp. A23]|uniref:PDZ domain-containing protein n=1 Tax=Terasakiella sp. FCG-A23 TaxID=3080561 RepID=UPI0029537E03|nr:PDZ domain-containing protein [Terasakiella sp. A23]MDV7339403.1 PDZ domain-containing protein [Terasakiella sp. A23]